MLSGIKREIDGAAFEEGLLSPGAKQLVGGQQVEAGGLLADSRGGRERGEEVRFAGDDGSGGDAEQEEEQDAFVEHVIAIVRYSDVTRR